MKHEEGQRVSVGLRQLGYGPVHDGSAVVFISQLCNTVMRDVMPQTILGSEMFNNQTEKRKGSLTRFHDVIKVYDYDDV